MTVLTGASGVLLALALALAAKLVAGALGAWWMDGQIAPVSPVLCAIILGILWRTCISVGYGTGLGLTRVTRTVLPVGIALIGLRLTLVGVKEVGALAIPVVASCIAVALITSAAVGRLLQIPVPLRHLLAVGTAVCGCTAVVAAAPAVRARPEHTGLALTCVVLFGCFGMLVYPWLARDLFGGDTQAVGVFLGTAIHDTSQVVGSSLIYAQEFSAPDAVTAASLTKLLRNLSILLLVPLAAYWVRNGAGAADGTHPRTSLREAIPMFLIAFIVLAILRNVGDSLVSGSPSLAHRWHHALDVTHAVSEFLLVVGMTAVGLSISLGQMRDIGWRAPVMALTVALCVSTCSAAVISWLRF